MVAELCKVDRRTIFRRRRHGHAAFRAELERGCSEIWADSIDRMRMLISRSLDILHEELGNEYDRSRVRAAGMVLNTRGCAS